MAPFALVDDLGKFWAYVIYLLIGMAFGISLEVAGFANSRKLAAQFYFTDLTVLKVMFTGIVTAMVLIFLASAAGILEYNAVYVNTTYLWPGIVGGLIMGVGFVLGGFCPGTSLVALASLKIDGFFFFAGLLVGVFAFGETVGLFDTWWYSSYMGRYTLPDWLGLSTGLVLLLVVLMAVGAFWMAERAEAAFGGGGDGTPRLTARGRTAGAGALVVMALVVMGMGQPTPEEKWAAMADEKAPLLEERRVQIEAGEFVEIATNNGIHMVLLDIRDEADFNLFHLVDAERVDLEEIRSGAMTAGLLENPANTVVVLVSNDEVQGTAAWKLLVAEGVLNVYVLEGGMNGWLDQFAGDGACGGCRRKPGNDIPGSLRYAFDVALGHNRPIADPDLFRDLDLPYTRKVTLEVKQTLSGGCG